LSEDGWECVIRSDALNPSKFRDRTLGEELRVEVFVEFNESESEPEWDFARRLLDVPFSACGNVGDLGINHLGVLVRLIILGFGFDKGEFASWAPSLSPIMYRPPPFAVENLRQEGQTVGVVAGICSCGSG
jgi:hypothetical protein